MKARSQVIFGPGLVTALLFVRYSWAECFLPDGTVRLSGSPSAADYQPCDSGAAVSMCCAIGRDRSADICLPGGICKNEYQGDGSYWRESCTDRTWKSSSCVKLFVDGLNATTDVPLWQCDDASWCRNDGGDTGRQCCREGQGYFVENGNATRTKPKTTTTTSSSVTMTTSSSDTTSSRFTSPASTSPADVSSSSTSTAAKIGIGVGVSLGVIIIILLVAILFMFRRRRHVQESRRPDGISEYNDDSSGAGGMALRSMGDDHGEPKELESPISTSKKERKTYLPYREPSPRYSPAELSSEGIPAQHESSRSP